MQIYNLSEQIIYLLLQLLLGIEGHLYVRKETSFGAIYFFKDYVPITETEYLRDTEVQQQ